MPVVRAPHRADGPFNAWRNRADHQPRRLRVADGGRGHERHAESLADKREQAVVAAGLKAHARDEPGPLGRAIGDGPQPGAFLEKDERVVPEQPQVDDLVGGERVRGRQRHQYWLPNQRDSVKARGTLNIKGGDREVDLTPCGHREHVARRVLAQRHVDPWVGGVKRREQPGQVKPGQRLHRAQDEPPAGEALEGGHLLAGGVHFGQRAAGSQEEDLARLGQPHPAT